jgi:outer membrane protein OmpA-like peptidoglycan-associated protein
MKPLAALLLAAALLAGCQSTPPAPATFIVFFTSGSAELTPDAQAAIGRAAEAARGGVSQVAIASGVAQGDNLKLAEPRYLAVQRALVARGVAERLIARSSLPDTGVNSGPTADTRVEIIVSR